MFLFIILYIIYIVYSYNLFYGMFLTFIMHNVEEITNISWCLVIFFCVYAFTRV